MSGDGAVTEACMVIRRAHAGLVARLAGDGTGPDGPLLPILVMVDTSDARLAAWPADSRQQLDDLCQLGRHENIIVHLSEGPP